MATEKTSVGSEAESRAKHVADEARGEAERIAHEATAAGRDIMERQRASIASELDSIAKALKKAAGAMHDEHQDAMARYTGVAADGLSGFAHDLRGEDMGSLVHRVNDYARRQPGVFLGGAVAIGFVLSRFLKSGTEARPSSSASESSVERGSSYPYSTRDVEESSLVHSTAPIGPSTGEHLP